MGMITLRCRQCGWVSETDPEEIPRYGARVRCGQCGTLLPLQRAGSALERAAEPMGPAQADSGDTLGEAAPAPPTRDEAREILLMWMRGLEQTSGRLLTESILFRDYREELARLFAMWQVSRRGPKAREIFREELLVVLGLLHDLEMDRGSGENRGGGARGADEPLPNS